MTEERRNFIEFKRNAKRQYQMRAVKAKPSWFRLMRTIIPGNSSNNAIYTKKYLQKDEKALKNNYEVFEGTNVLLIKIPDVQLRGQYVYNMGDAYAEITKGSSHIPRVKFLQLKPEFHDINLRNCTQDYDWDWKTSKLFISFVHPHISPDGNPCWGEFQDGINAMLRTQRFYHVATIIKQYLSCWNPESPYWDINYFYRKSKRAYWRDPLTGRPIADGVRTNGGYKSIPKSMHAKYFTAWRITKADRVEDETGRVEDFVLKSIANNTFSYESYQAYRDYIWCFDKAIKENVLYNELFELYTYINDRFNENGRYIFPYLGLEQEEGVAKIDWMREFSKKVSIAMTKIRKMPFKIDTHLLHLMMKIGKFKGDVRSYMCGRDTYPTASIARYLHKANTVNTCVHSAKRYFLRQISLKLFEYFEPLERNNYYFKDIKQELSIEVSKLRAINLKKEIKDINNEVKNHNESKRENYLFSK